MYKTVTDASEDSKMINKTLCSSITGEQCEDLKNTVQYGINRHLLNDNKTSVIMNTPKIYNQLINQFNAGATYAEVKAGLIKTMQENVAHLK